MSTTFPAGSARASRTPIRFGRIFPPDERWLAMAEPEAILDPALPIVDAHHHLWDLRGTAPAASMA
jgi:hypothetical protein